MYGRKWIRKDVHGTKLNKKQIKGIKNGKEMKYMEGKMKKKRGIWRQDKKELKRCTRKKKKGYIQWTFEEKI